MLGMLSSLWKANLQILYILVYIFGIRLGGKAVTHEGIRLASPLGAHKGSLS